MKDEIRKLAKIYKVKVKFFKAEKGTPIGYADVYETILHIDTSLSRNYILTTFFHELGHIHCVRNGLWKTYHWIHREGTDKQCLDKFKATAYKAECWVDKWGEQEFKKHYPKLRYIRCYKAGKKDKIKRLQKYYKPWLTASYKHLAKRRKKNPSQ